MKRLALLYYLLLTVSQCYNVLPIMDGGSLIGGTVQGYAS